ncbi:MAG: hypothetical protein HYX60_02820 [Legionella longbeachae]|nr:hypothetical protein [Legionella longbeachae]
MKSDDVKGNVIKKVIPFEKNNLIKNGIENLFPESIIKIAREHKKAFIDFTPKFEKEILL